MIPKELELVRFDTLKKLFNKLAAKDFLSDKVYLYDQRIEIVFHTDFILSITLKNYFEIRINDVLSISKIEDADIWETLHDYFQEDVVYIEHEDLFGKNKILMLSSDEYTRQRKKLQRKSNVKIFTIRRLLYKS